VSAASAIAAAWLATAAVADTPPAAAPAAQAPLDPEAAGAAADPAPAPLTAPEGPDQQAAIQAAYQAAEALQGPLDGLWRVTDTSGHTLFIFDLSDAGGPPAPLAASPDHPEVEGAWRDPDRPRAPDASGFIDSVRGDGRWVQIRFVAGPDRRGEVVTLKAAANGRWTGELADAVTRHAVIMTRL
jgi:hypothetical protein